KCDLQQKICKQNLYLIDQSIYHLPSFLIKAV
ncbi:MAG: hypothetical protein ACI8QG_001496, partial [Flavobacteriales bacterium]